MKGGKPVFEKADHEKCHGTFGDEWGSSRGNLWKMWAIRVPRCCTSLVSMPSFWGAPFIYSDVQRTSNSWFKAFSEGFLCGATTSLLYRWDLITLSPAKELTWVDTCSSGGISSITAACLLKMLSTMVGACFNLANRFVRKCWDTPSKSSVYMQIYIYIYNYIYTHNSFISYIGFSSFYP